MLNNSGEQFDSNNNATKHLGHKNRYDAQPNEHPDSMPSQMTDFQEEDHVLVTVDQDQVDLDFPEVGMAVTVNNAVSESISNYADSEVTFKTPTRPVQQQQPQQQDFVNLRGDPAFEKFIKKCVAEEVRESSRRASLERESILKDPNSGKKTSQTTANGRCGNAIKSPSDTTIYAPALQKTPEKIRELLSESTPLRSGRKDLNEVLNEREGDQVDKVEQPVLSLSNEQLAKHISQFIEGIRIQSTVKKVLPTSTAVRDEDSNRRHGNDEPGTSETSFDRQVTEARDRANKLIIEAEKFKASVNTPSGNNQFELNSVVNNTDATVNAGNLGTTLDQDDQFFHVTCHIDENLRLKIQKGDYVELDKLLPKQKGDNSRDSKLDLVFKDGHSFFVPAVPNNRINSVRRWEQAFRVYAAIYSQANPNRAAEIWQYVHVINTAASAYTWENVASYDLTFRHLMAANPQRSWAKLYHQMWNISLRDPLPKNFGYQNQNHFGSNHSSSNWSGKFDKVPQKGNGYQGSKDQKDKVTTKPKYCWDFNRGKQCKDGDKCRYVNRCLYCDSPSHPKFECPKKR